jgi:hypothetical protein
MSIEQTGCLNNGPYVIGVHGVGYTQVGSVRTALAPSFLSGVTHFEVDEVNWADIFDPGGGPDEGVKPRSIGRLTRAILTAGSRDFEYGFFRKSLRGSRNDLLSTLDTIVYLSFITLVFLAPSQLLLVMFFKLPAVFGFGISVFNHSQILLTYWIVVLGINATVLWISGFTRQLTQRGFDGSTLWWVAARIALRRIILTITTPLFGIAFGFGSQNWVASVGFALITLSTILAFLLPLVVPLLNLYLRYAGESPDIIARSSPIFSYKLLYGPGLGILVVAVSLHLYKIVRPVAKTVADALLYIGDRRYRRNLLHMISDKLDPAMKSNRPVIVVGHSLGSVLAFDYIKGRRRYMRSKPYDSSHSRLTPLSSLLAFFPSPV